MQDSGFPALPISLRDWFAGMALQGILSNPGIIDIKTSQHSQALAVEAYDMADAMLKERGKP